MKVLLDECIPRRLKNALSDHECRTVPEAGFAGQKNGLLISLAEAAGFDLFLTMDKGLQYQQNLEGRNIAILIVRAKSNGPIKWTSLWRLAREAGTSWDTAPGHRS
jgi:predicted nuclease of predicted toxin-antitoxin system